MLVYEPSGEPSAEARRTGPEKPNLTPARALFIRLMDEYRASDYKLTLLEIQKLAYFLLLEVRHTPAFWSRIERSMPDYGPRREWLAANGYSFLV